MALSFESTLQYLSTREFFASLAPRLTSPATEVVLIPNQHEASSMALLGVGGVVVCSGFWLWKRFFRSRTASSPHSSRETPNQQPLCSNAEQHWSIFSNQTCGEGEEKRKNLLRTLILNSVQFLMKGSSPEDNWNQLDRIVPKIEANFQLPNENKLGTGGGGDVYAETLNGEAVAVKVVKFVVNDPDNSKFVCRIQREVLIMRIVNSLNHPNLISIKGFRVITERSELQVVMPKALFHLGDLVDHRNSELTESAKLDLALQIAEGLANLHEIGIVHRDLKPKNVLIFEPCQPKLCDFGISRASTDATGEITENLGTVDWTAPEIKNAGKIAFEKEISNPKSDVYSLGLLIRFIFTGKRPREQLSAQDILPPNLQELINQCLNDISSDRPSAREVCTSLRSIEIPPTVRPT